MAGTLMRIACFMVACMVVFAPHANGITCGEVVLGFASCLGYLENGGPLPASCCNGVKELSKASTATDKKTAYGCLKRLFSGIKGIKPALISGLPSKCGVRNRYKIIPSTNYNNVWPMLYIPDSVEDWRGVAANYPFRALTVGTVDAARNLVQRIYDVNVRYGRLRNIFYRESNSDLDMRQAVYRWDNRPFEDIFVNGFVAREPANIEEHIYYNLDRYVHAGGRPLDDGAGIRPLDTRRATSYSFVSTTQSFNWCPSIFEGETRRAYRYEIYAPGGIEVGRTLGSLYHHRSQEEIAFPGGIANTYVISCQLFELTHTRGTRYTVFNRVDNTLHINSLFNPHRDRSFVERIYRPIYNYVDRNTNTRNRLTLEVFSPENKREKLHDTSFEDAITLAYLELARARESYIDAAFRSTRTNEVYVFFQDEFARLDYAPGTKNDRVIEGPLVIRNEFQSLIGTRFGAYGLDAAFSCHGVNESFIFSGDMCAKINYDPEIDSIIDGPKAIKEMFPFFNGTDFEYGVDAAFESSTTDMVYIFKGKDVAVVDYKNRTLHYITPIVEEFMCLDDTFFAEDIGAAFASHIYGEAYLFKENKYVILHYDPDHDVYEFTTDLGDIVPDWNSLKNILPRKNVGVDMDFDATGPDDERDQDDW